MTRSAINARAKWVLLIAAGCLSEHALAQAFNRAQINRPTLTGPSQQVGLIGGNFTGRLGDVLGPGAPSNAIARATENAVSLATPGGGRFGFRGGDTSFRRNRFITNELPPIATPTLSSADFGYRPSPSLIQQLTPSLKAIEGNSGMVNAFNLDRPLGAALETPFPITQTTFYTRPAASPYHEFFGLVPATSDEPSDDALNFGKPGVPPPENLDELALNELKVQQQTRDNTALALFRDATRGSVSSVPQLEQLATAVRQLERWRRNDSNDFRPVLLVAHAALETDSVTTAITALGETARRRPTLFVDGTDPGQFFGDREVYQRQLRKYVRTGSGAIQETPETLVIEAYCAFLLGDKIRAQDATDRAEKLAQERSFAKAVDTSGVNLLIWSIRAAVQQ